MSQPVPLQRRPNRAGERRREQMLEAAERLVREHGHVNVTMQMIAEAVGVRQPAVHHHFASRDELFVALLRHRDAHPAEEGSADVLEALLDAARNNARSPNLAALFTDYATRAVEPGHPARAFFAERNAAFLPTVAAAIRQRQARGGIAPGVEADRLALLLVSLADGLLARWLIDPGIDMRGELQFALDVVAVRRAELS